MSDALRLENCPAESLATCFDDCMDRVDLHLRSAAMQLLAENPIFSGRLVKCRIVITVVDGNLTLQGRVPTWHLKQLLQESLRRMDGVGSIKNQIVVVKPDGSIL